MVRESVFQDLRDHLVDFDWIPNSAWELGDSYDPSEILGLVSQPIVLTDYFPVNAIYQGEEVEVNTLAIDQGTPGEPRYVEMGGEDREQHYVFNLAFFGESDAVALSLFSDLSDRYKGTRPGFLQEVTLFNYLEATPTPVGNGTGMEVVSFEVAKSPEQPAPGRLLWFAQLIVKDYLELD